MARSAKLFNFAGITPQLDDALLNANGAMVAENVDLGRGDLIPFKWDQNPSSVTNPINTLVEVDKGNVHAFNFDTDVAFGTGADNDLGRVFWSAGGIVRYDDRSAFVNGSKRRLGVGRPTTAITEIQDTGTCSEPQGCEAFSSFCYTFVNKFGQESAPSPVTSTAPYSTNKLKLRIPNDSFVISLWDVTTIRVYRTYPNYSTGIENQLTSGGEWFLALETGVQSAGQLVTLDVDKVVMDIMPSTTWELPPIDVTSLAMCPDTDTLVLAHDNIVHFSEPGNHHAFPRDRDVVLSDNIVAIRYFKGLIVVLTDGHPYVLTFRRSEAGPPVWNVERADESFPCVSKKSVTVGETGVVWASTDGVFTLNYTRYGMNIKSLTATVVHLEDWRACQPETIRGALHNGTYFFTADGAIKNSVTGHESRTWMLTYDKTVYDQPKNIFLSSLSIYPDVWYKSRTDKLYYAIGNMYGVWNPDVGEVFPYEYSSRIMVEPGLTNYSAAKVVHDRDGDLTFEIWRENSANPVLLYSRPLTHSEPFRLPNTLLSVDHFVRLVGTSRVRRVHIADSLYALTNTDDTTMTYGNARLTQR